MSLPAWAMAPDSGERKPILIGPWAPAVGAPAVSASATIAPSASSTTARRAISGSMTDPRGTPADFAVLLRGVPRIVIAPSIVGVVGRARPAT